VADIFQEVDEDLKQERYLKLWRKYGAYVVGAAVALVLGTASIVGWREYQAAQRAEEGGRYEAALTLARYGKSEQALAAFAALGADSGAGYVALAGLQEAALKAKEGDMAGAVAVYERLTADASVDGVLRDMATLLAVLYSLDSGDPAALAARLAPLTTDSNPWRFSALELRGLLALKSGDVQAARAVFTRLVDDPAAPPAVRQRAGETLQIVGE